MKKSNLSKDKLNWSGVYMIVFGDGSKYIGSTSRTIYQRIKEHWYLLDSNKHYNIKMQYCYNTYGIQSIEALHFCGSAQWCDEQKYIDKYKPNLNIIRHVAKYNKKDG